MIGAIIGDFIGSIYEWNNIKTTDFPLFSDDCRFTDDSVMSIAVAEALMNGTDMSASMRKFGRLYPQAGYGGRFSQWLLDDTLGDYGSYGNGSAMRVSSAGWIAGSLEEALSLARSIAIPTHSHPEGIRGAQVIAGCIWLLRSGADNQVLLEWVRSMGYAMDFTLSQIRPHYTFDVSCQGSVPQAIEAFLEADSFEGAIRNAISIGGDSDTIASIAGALAEARYGVPLALAEYIAARMPAALYEPLASFERRYAAPLPDSTFCVAPPSQSLLPLSAPALNRYWSHLSSRYSHRHQTIFPAFDVFVHEMKPVFKQMATLAGYPVCTFNLVAAVAYYAEGLLAGNTAQEEIDAGPASIFFGTDPVSSNPAYRYMITLIEDAISQPRSTHLRDYLRRRINTLHKTPVVCLDASFRQLITLHKQEYAAACSRQDYEQAWKLLSLNRLLYQMQMLAID